MEFRSPLISSRRIIPAISNQPQGANQMRFIRQLLLFVLASMPLSAQVTTATLYGVIKDPSGAVLPGVSITTTHQGTGQSRSVVSDERGEFALPALPVGGLYAEIGAARFQDLHEPGDATELRAECSPDVRARSRTGVGKHHGRGNCASCRDGFVCTTTITG